MRVLVGIPEPLETRPDDFNWVVPEEVLSLSTSLCATEAARDDCGCGRSLTGIESLKSATYGAVAEMDTDALRAQLSNSAVVAEWSDHGPVFDLHWDELVRIGNALVDDPIGTEVRVAVTPTEFTLIRATIDATSTLPRASGFDDLCAAALAARDDHIVCDEHGAGSQAFVCVHLVDGTGVGFNADEPTEGNPWPDAWCDACDATWTAAGGWENVPDEDQYISLVCHQCYESIRERQSGSD